MNQASDDQGAARTRMDALSLYLRDITQHPLLSQEEEQCLAEQARLHEGKQARHRLIEANLRLVVSIAKKYQGQGLDRALHRH